MLVGLFTPAPRDSLQSLLGCGKDAASLSKLVSEPMAAAGKQKRCLPAGRGISPYCVENRKRWESERMVRDAAARTVGAERGKRSFIFIDEAESILGTSVLEILNEREARSGAD